MTSSVESMLEVFDVTPLGDHRYEGTSDAGERDIIDASQVLSQSVVAASKSLPGKVVRHASAIFFRPVRAGSPVDLNVDVLHDGRSFATAIVSAGQGHRQCATAQVMLDRPQPDVIRHPHETPDSGPASAVPIRMPMVGREVRVVGLADPDDPDEIGPPVLDAWLRYKPVPGRPDLARALLAHFTGHLSVSTAMRAHAGIGTAMAHKTLSTGVLGISITFHEPVEWGGWLLYAHESTFAGAGVAFARGQIRTEGGRPIASFTQDSLLRRIDTAAAGVEERARL